LPSGSIWPLFDGAASKHIEQAALAAAAPHALMARAGLGVARLALALAPRARRVWVLAGPGNNGGDGLVAARHLHGQGVDLRVSLVGDAGRLPADALDALAQARQAGVSVTSGPRSPWPAGQAPEVIVDALLGLGASRPPDGAIADAVRLILGHSALVLAVDLPTGLCGDTGRRLGDLAVVATHTLSLLTLKPGLFTAEGRDHAGRVWFDRLGVADPVEAPTAKLAGPDTLRALMPLRAHAQHKGSFGDVLVLGGAPGMGGAALLASRAALTAGAGRVYLARLGDDLAPDVIHPELMPRSVQAAIDPALLARCTVVCGCGGGTLVRSVLPAVLAHAARLVLDADGLNAVAADATLRAALAGRAAHGLASVLTPHPLEAARLLGVDAAAVQADRRHAAQTLADSLHATVVLKGSGTLIASPGQVPWINPTGNARLGSGGTGDVLAGWLGGQWAQTGATQAVDAAVASVWLHGWAAEQPGSGDPRLPLRAADLITAMAANLPPAG
jgi:hydroxyethylthiazole kinase-like uncharacterized protein yjeF